MSFDMTVGIVWVATAVCAFVFQPALYLLVPLTWATFVVMLVRARR